MYKNSDGRAKRPSTGQRQPVPRRIQRRKFYPQEYIKVFRGLKFESDTEGEAWQRSHDAEQFYTWLLIVIILIIVKESI